MKPVIVVPVYRSSLDPEEVFSLELLNKHLGSYPISFVGPKRLQSCAFRKHVAQASYQAFADSFFTGIVGYNNLLLSKSFYWRFQDFSHILIAQTDSLVLSDQLLFWCNQPFDYIGAPWLEGYTRAAPESPFLGVGNGGFALRKVSTALQVLNSWRWINSPRSVVGGWRMGGYRLSGFLKMLRELTIGNNTYWRCDKFGMNEDVFWGQVAPNLFPWYRVPDYQTAARFSFETQPRRLLRDTNGHLPFGCHAWARYDAEFWIEILPEISAVRAKSAA